MTATRDAQVLTDADLIDAHSIGPGSISSASISTRQYVTTAMCGVLAMVDGFDSQAMAFAAPALAADLGLSAAQLGSVLSAGLMGSLAGTFLQGPIGDHVGRKPVLFGSFLLMALATLATVAAATTAQLFALRLIAGVAIGAALPNLFAIVSDHAPPSRRYLFVTAMFTGLPLGAVLGGALVAKLLPTFGWHSVFYFGGLLPLLLLPLLWTFVPESTSYIDRRNHAKPGVQSVRELFTQGRGPGTLLLWSVSFLSLLVSIFITSWLPTILHQAGATISTAVIGSVVLNGGGIIGSLTISWLIDRRGLYRLLPLAYVAGAVALASIGALQIAGNAVTALIFLVGLFFIGGQMCIASVVSFFYPSALRATGIGWAMGIGRIGAIVGPMIGGLLLSWHVAVENLFYLAAAVTLAAAGVWVAVDRARRRLLSG